MAQGDRFLRLEAVTATVAVAAAAIEAQSLYRFFRAGEEETLALRGVSLRLEPGEFVAVVGPSGSGKSTLLGCLAGTDEPDGGTVRIQNIRLSHQPEPVRARMRSRHIGLLFQSNNLLAHLTVRQNVSLTQRMARGVHRTPVASVLESLGIAGRADAYPSQLSGGEIARAGLAVALANDPVVLLADEPTGELDHATERAVLDLLSARTADGVAVLVASHSPAVAVAADRIIELADGQVVS
jgi:putative ABC transport system ATP-binding protein